jgi:large subunit ribosomal protein L28
MARRCSLTGKGVHFGRNVSHSNVKTSRRFLPNLKKVSLMSEALGRTVTLKVSTAALKTVQHRGGLDAFLLSTPDDRLPEEAQRLKRRVKKARAGQPAKTAATAG